MNLNIFTGTADSRVAGTLDGEGNANENEYARINRLLSDMGGAMGKSMEEIQNINLKMRMISFNSKIEAARAGDAGRAFSIVSDEMKSLSEKTATVAKQLRVDTGRSIEELKNISDEIATNVRGTRLSDLALTNIDLIDRNLYERSCDVRWWATDSSLVDALESHDEDAFAHASRRLGVILNAYTVYFDLVLCDPSGVVVANDRPQNYQSKGMNQAAEPWFRQAMTSRSGDHYGFQSVHASGLVKGKRVLIYSAAVREGGLANGKVLGALGIVFNYDALAQVIVHNTPIGEDLKQATRVCITDARGLVLADSHDRLLQDTLSFRGMERLYGEAKSFVIEDIGGQKYCIAHAQAPGFETYSTGWHSLIMQQI